MGTKANGKKTMLLIDSHALIYRAYYAYPPTLTTPEGEPINAVFGYTNLLLEVLLKFKPTHVVAVMDSEGPTIRATSYNQYKANRKEIDDLLLQQLPRVMEIIEAFKIPLLLVPGYEADDIIGTIDHKHSGSWAETIVITGDRDLFQLVDDDTFVYLAGSAFSQSKLFDAKMVKEKMGVEPEFIPDFKGLSGDASDNIPGVRGIGPKSAVELISQYGTLEQIYENIEHVNKKYATKLIENHEIAVTSKELATIFKNVPLTFNFEECRFENLDVGSLRDTFNTFQFKSLLPKLDKLAEYYVVEKDLNYGLFEVQTQEDLVRVSEWDGKECSGDEIYFLFDIESTDGPLNYKLASGVFMTESSDEVFVFQDHQIQAFADLCTAKDKVYTFDLKNIQHVFLNYDISYTRDNIFDLGVACVIAGAGKYAYTLKSLMGFVDFSPNTDIAYNLASLKIVKTKLDQMLAKISKQSELISLELRVLMVVLQMERNGIKLDLEMIHAFEQKLTNELEILKREIYSNAGHEFNINSPKQLGDVLFSEKQLPTNKKTKGGAYSTNELTLQKLIGADPIVENILNYRETGKLISTYLKTLPSYVDRRTGKIHAVFDSLGAVSGRFSSKNPNMQNIPKGESQGICIRDSFVAEKGKVFVGFDYSQQELRILAALSQEGIMIDSFNNEEDIHRFTASELFGVEESEVTKEQRNVGKTINFAVIYGISAFALSERLKIPREQATDFINKYFAKYKNVRKFLDGVIGEAEKVGFTETVLGRKRINEAIFASNKILKSAAQRELFNFIIQGSAADIMKLSMVRFDSLIDSYPAKLLLQIHDEFLFEFEVNDVAHPQKDANFMQFVHTIYDTMISIYDLGVKYQVEVSVGTQWGKMQELNIS